MRFVMTIYRGVSVLVSRAEDIFLGIAMIVMAIAVFVQIITRYALKISVPGLELMALNTMIMLVFIGTAVCIRQRAHLNIDILPRVIRSKLSLDTISLGLNVITLVMVSFFAATFYKYMMFTWSKPFRLTELGNIHMGYFQSVAFAGCVLWAVHCLVIVVKDGISLVKGTR